MISKQNKSCMTKNLDTRKYKLIQEIIKIEEESSIAKIENQVKAIEEENNIWQTVIKPMRKTISLQQMKQEQNYKPLDAKTFFELAEKVGVEESIEELLAMLD